MINYVAPSDVKKTTLILSLKVQVIFFFSFLAIKVALSQFHCSYDFNIKRLIITVVGSIHYDNYFEK